MSHRLILNIETVGSLILPCLSLWLVNHYNSVLHSNCTGVVLIFSSFNINASALCNANSWFDLITNSADDLLSVCAPHSGR